MKIGFHLTAAGLLGMVIAGWHISALKEYQHGLDDGYRIGLSDGKLKEAFKRVPVQSRARPAPPYYDVKLIIDGEPAAHWMEKARPPLITSATFFLTTDPAVQHTYTVEVAELRQ